MRIVCENHPKREAKWYRIPFAGNGLPNIPICYECLSKYKMLNLDKALKIIPISGGTQGEGEAHENRPV